MTDNDTTRRRFLQATGGTAAAVALAGCSGGGGDEGQDDTETLTPEEETERTTREQTQSDKTYKLTNSTMTTLDPIAATDTASGVVIQSLFDALTNYPNGETTTENLLAESLNVNDDVTEITFTLRDDITYNHDDYGDVVASDVVYSFERLAQSSNSRRASFILGFLGVEHETEGEEDTYVPGSLGIEATGEKEVTITLAQPFHAIPELLAYTSFSVIPEGVVGDIEGYDGDMSYEEFTQETPVGAGPFSLDTWDSGSECEIAARPIDEYHNEGPYVSAVHWRIAEDDNALYTYTVINENADHPYIPNSQYDAEKVSIEGRDSQGRQYGTYGPLENDRTVPYYQVEEIATYYFGFNQKNTEKAVRQAFAYAMNQQQMVEEVLNGPGLRASHFTPPGIYPGGKEAYLNHADNYPYGLQETRIDQARQVMEDAGYGDDNPYELELTIYQSEFFSEASGILRDQLASAHVDVQIQQAEFSTLLSRGRNGDLEAYSLGWIMDYPAPDNFLQLLNPPQTDTSLEAPVSYTDWDPEESEAAQRATDAWEQVQNNPAPEEGKEARNEAYIAMEEANWEDVVFVNLLHPVAEHFRYDWVKKPRVGAAGSSRQKKNAVHIEDRDV
jgi:peptide/nickel transport system substrate-binding protein